MSATVFVTTFLQVSLYLPPLRVLRNVIERMKNLAPHVSLTASRKGTLIISVSTDSVEVSTYFKNLQMPDWGEFCFC